MAVTRWESAQEMLRRLERINRLFQSHGELDDDQQLVSGTWSPACDILETADALVLRAELPGVRQSDIDISLDQGVLTLRGNRELEKEDEERTYHRIERSYGHFSRAFTLPRMVDAEKISASYVDGVLEIRMPRREASKPRQIRIGEQVETTAGSGEESAL
jgi:HSP20 family protein